MANKEHTIIVDSVYGSDSLGTRESYPFATLEAALAAVQAGDIILCMPGTHTLAAGITLGLGVKVVGSTMGATIVQLTVGAVATTLATMGQNTAFENLTLKLVSTQHAAFKGVHFPINPDGPYLVAAFMKNVRLIIDNSAASGAGTSAVTGVFADADGPVTEEFMPFDAPRLDNCSIEVITVGGGVKRGILVTGGGGGSCVVEARDCDVAIACTGLAGTDAIAVETNHAHAVAILRRCHLMVNHRSDAATWTKEAHVSKTLGFLSVSADMGYLKANGLGLSVFSTGPGYSQTFSDIPKSKTFAYNAGLGAGVTRYLCPGTAAPVANEIATLCKRPVLLLGISVRARVPPETEGDTYTLRVGGVDTTITCLLAIVGPGQGVGYDFSHSEQVLSAGTFSVKLATGAGQTVAAQDVVIEVFYMS